MASDSPSRPGATPSPSSQTPGPSGPGTARAASGTTAPSRGRETFSSRSMFLFAAIGSAVGLGNIWRFPYVAYDSGGGAFLVPYLVALLTAGIPLLWLFFGLGHRYRGSAPLVYRRIHRAGEPLGWFQVGVAFFITIYYAVIVAWSGIYTVRSVTKAWGDDPEGFFFKEFLRMDSTRTFSLDVVWPIAAVLVLVWVVTVLTLVFDVSSGIGRMTTVFVPVLVVLFAVLVVRSLFLDGASAGLDALFSPKWDKLGDSSVWIAAYGQIFFSLSIGFGIMTTYASYLKPRTNLTGTGMVTAFANSSFEVLAGIGVFAALGFMATRSGVAVDEVASSGIGLAFVAFPTIINQMPAGALFGVLFFASLFLAGLTSLISLLEVVVSAVKDKFDLPRRRTAICVGTLMTVLSVALFSTTSGLVTLDIMDKFTNNIGIVAAAVAAIVVVGYVTRRMTEIEQHLNAVSSVRVGLTWKICVMVITPIALAYMLVNELITLIREPYEGYAQSQLVTYGWAVLAVIVIAAVVLTAVSFRGSTTLDGLPGSDFGVPPRGRPKGTPNPLATASAIASPAAAGSGRPADATDTTPRS
nr:sodium-dependent transporter [Corynebacterium bovis]